MLFLINRRHHIAHSEEDVQHRSPTVPVFRLTSRAIDLSALSTSGDLSEPRLALDPKVRLT